MESYGNERKVQQGEDWNLDLLLSSSNREYIPYIVSSQRNNPFFVVTVASTKYEKNLRYVKSWWNSVSDLYIPTFFGTNPVWYGELDFYSQSLPDEPSDNPSDPTYGDSAERRYLYQYTDIDDDIDPSLGHRPYKYFYFDYSDNTVSRIDGYSCNVRFNFPSYETAEWTGQNYLYQLTLVSGQTLADKMTEIYNYYHDVEGLDLSDWPDTVPEQYRYVKVRWPDILQPDIDEDSPLGYIEIPEPILQPTKLEVFNNLRRLI